MGKCEGKALVNREISGHLGKRTPIPQKKDQQTASNEISRRFTKVSQQRFLGGGIGGGRGKRPGDKKKEGS